MPTRKMRVLRLPLKAEYFDAIKSGSKTEEYRLFNAYWKKRLIGKEFDEIVLTKGYPRKSQRARHLSRPWRGYSYAQMQHEEFGPTDVFVFVIPVNPPETIVKGMSR